MYWKKITDLETKQTSQELERSQLAIHTNMSVAGCKDSILQALADLGQSQDRFTALSALVDRYRTTMRGPFDVAAKERREHALNQVLRLYGQFDVASFEEDCDLLAIERGEDTNAQKAMASLHGKIGQTTRKINGIREDVLRCFHEVPVRWRTYRRKPDKKQELEMADRIVRHFASDWRTRAPLFEVPVTVTGYAIHTLPSHKRRVAEEAYNLLELGALRKRPYYKFHVSHEPEIEASQAPHEMFNPKERDA